MTASMNDVQPRNQLRNKAAKAGFYPCESILDPTSMEVEPEKRVVTARSNKRGLQPDSPEIMTTLDGTISIAFHFGYEQKATIYFQGIQHAAYRVVNVPNDRADDLVASYSTPHTVEMRFDQFESWLDGRIKEKAT